MSFPTQTFDCNPSKWQGIRRAAAAKGVEVPDAMSGELTHKEVTIRFQREGNTLTVDLVSMPWKYKLVPQALIISKVRELFEQV